MKAELFKVVDIIGDIYFLNRNAVEVIYDGNKLPGEKYSSCIIKLSCGETVKILGRTSTEVAEELEIENSLKSPPSPKSIKRE